MPFGNLLRTVCRTVPPVTRNSALPSPPEAESLHPVIWCQPTVLSGSSETKLYPFLRVWLSASCAYQFPFSLLLDAIVQKSVPALGSTDSTGLGASYAEATRRLRILLRRHGTPLDLTGSGSGSGSPPGSWSCSQLWQSGNPAADIQTRLTTNILHTYEDLLSQVDKKWVIDSRAACTITQMRCNIPINY